MVFSTMGSIVVLCIMISSEEDSEVDKDSFVISFDSEDSEVDNDSFVISFDSEDSEVDNVSS